MSEPLAPALLALLRCPLTGQELRPAPPETLSKLAWPAALVTADGTRAYPIREGIPILLLDEAAQL